MKHCRMFPETFQMILGVIGPRLCTNNNAVSGKEVISAEKQLLIAIWFMATPDSYRYIYIYIATKFAVIFNSHIALL